VGKNTVWSESARHTIIVSLQLDSKSVMHTTCNA